MHRDKINVFFAVEVTVLKLRIVTFLLRTALRVFMFFALTVLSRVHDSA